MTYNFFEVMLAKTDTELYEIVNGPADDYQQTALEAAREEYSRRNFSLQQLRSLKKKQELKQQTNKGKPEAAVENGEQVLEKFFPGIINSITPGSLPEDEMDKKTRKILKWILTWLSIGLIVVYFLLELIF